MQKHHILFLYSKKYQIEFYKLSSVKFYFRCFYFRCFKSDKTFSDCISKEKKIQIFELFSMSCTKDTILQTNNLRL
jgi:hypothetical protein